uniref:Uncharacterized protein n=1 Tax=Helianthus annuus TaxID=4232 RepID=A0A251SC39_HELAN
MYFYYNWICSGHFHVSFSKTSNQKPSVYPTPTTKTRRIFRHVSLLFKNDQHALTSAPTYHVSSYSDPTQTLVLFLLTQGGNAILSKIVTFWLLDKLFTYSGIVTRDEQMHGLWKFTKNAGTER